MDTKTQQAKGVENYLKAIRKSHRFYKGEAEKFPEMELETCKTVRDSATEMLCDLGSVETTIEKMLDGVKRTRTDILRVLEKMDGVVATKEEEEKEKSRKRAAPPKKSQAEPPTKKTKTKAKAKK